jgi:predicted methyltransferase
MRLPFALAATLAFATPAIAQDQPANAGQEAVAPSALDAVLADPRRDADRARDAWRHPAEMLTVFKVQQGQTVVDVIPGGGWLTRILVPLLAGNGRYIALNPDVSAASEQARNYLGNLAATFPAKAAGWTGQPAGAILAYNTDGLPASLDGTVDRILILREMHNLHRMGLMHRELTTYRRLLKPDGLIGIEQHRARRDAPAAYTDGNKGYMREKDIVALMDLYGFELVAQSDINANPRDTANHPEGVWELPPSLRTKREELKAVGESDRMTLLFRKRP